MKILHTADWHLGHRLHEQSQFEEQSLFLNWLLNYIKEAEIDVLLISGDVFDTGSPSNQSLEMYYNFLVNLKTTTCKWVIITGGNHDSPGTLNAPKALLNALNIKVVGKATENINEEVFKVTIAQEELIVAAVPYLRDSDIRKAVAGESFEQLTDKYKNALIKHYTEAAHQAEKINANKAPTIAMGHLFAIGGSVSDSEQSIYVGTLGHIGAKDFPEYFNYVALGHLHRPQLVGGNPKIQYSGSPNILSFSELGYDKKIITLTTSNNKITNIEHVTVPCFRNVYKLTGSIEDCIAKFPSLHTNSYKLTPWVEINLKENNTVSTEVLKQEAEKYDFEILKITLKQQQKIKGIEELLKNVASVKELVPTEVFKLKCEEMQYDLKGDSKVWDAFNEIVQQVKEQ